MSVSIFALSLGVATGSVDEVHLTLPSRLSEPIELEIALVGEHERLVLWPHSVRSADFRLLLSAGGETVEAVAPEPTTVRGTILDHLGSTVAGTLADGELEAVVRMDPARMPLWIAPIDGAVQGTHRVTAAAPEHTASAGCVAVEMATAPIARRGVQTAGGGGQVCELAIDTDYEYFLANDASINDSLAFAERVLNLVDIVYQNDVHISYDLVAIVLRIDERDPYQSTSAFSMLTELRLEWLANQSMIERDVVHMLTGRVITGFPIGIAYQDSICSPSFGYGLSEAFFARDLRLRVSLIAHELGHNWGAPHCDGDPDGCRIMCSGTAGFCDDIGFFAPVSQEIIANTAATATCIDDAGAAVDPPPPGARSVRLLPVPRIR